MSVCIRSMKDEDIPYLASIEKECFSTPWSENSLRAELYKEDSNFFVLTENDVVAGYIGSNIVLDECYIANVAVSPSFRRKGYGRMLVETAVENAVQKQCIFITLEVRESNLPAIELYSGCGFVSQGKRKNFYSSPVEDCIIMTKYF